MRWIALARPRFGLESPWYCFAVGRVDVELAVSGEHMAMNAAAALAGGRQPRSRRDE
jgi:UDP-N-acetylmuramyl pentapeptide synthase